MTTRPGSRPAAGLAALAVPIVVGLLGFGGSALAQTVESRRDQPTPATLPDPEEVRQREGNRPIGQVAPPEAITSSTAVMNSDRKGKASYTNPLDHLPAKDRAGTGGGRRE
ncbi:MULTISPECIES: hypothetical protein [unclassified Methylobacterium]|uniref:hypothetical protein n=1 Tax=unclassified Methylobacterium TaxID=2615210 RepID=UPI000AB7D832|nr:MULTISPECIES: hypothetical protein [unclassified Methylobacterium]